MEGSEDDGGKDGRKDGGGKDEGSKDEGGKGDGTDEEEGGSEGAAFKSSLMRSRMERLADIINTASDVTLRQHNTRHPTHGRARDAHTYRLCKFDKSLTMTQRGHVLLQGPRWHGG